LLGDQVSDRQWSDIVGVIPAQEGALDADVAAGEDDLGDEAVPLGEDPAGDDHDEGVVGRCGEDRGEAL
jgi:hypothetical protein